ncbi:hypothetical protein PanWU01x14_002890 [Parasponia andersonii]|uniref:Uncharacterized protein n=1 Tax=Parasponia andersonii TaxID=3476 RepID=A0A2P5E5C0_PARAD|nr:hypothetical protein PanWU01x14_002890 [Parasponia andersonii]
MGMMMWKIIPCGKIRVSSIPILISFSNSRPSTFIVSLSSSSALSQPSARFHPLSLSALPSHSLSYSHADFTHPFSLSFSSAFPPSLFLSYPRLDLVHTTLSLRHAISASPLDVIISAWTRRTSKSRNLLVWLDAKE